MSLQVWIYFTSMKWQLIKQFMNGCTCVTLWISAVILRVCFFLCTSRWRTDLSLIISRIICMSSMCSLRTNRTMVQKRKLKKNTKQKSKNKDDSDVQIKVYRCRWRLGKRHWKVQPPRRPPKQKLSLHSLWWIHKIHMRRKVNTM